MNKYNLLSKGTALFVLVLLSKVVSAQGLAASLESVCVTIKTIVPVVALLMFILAGGIYAIGQVLGAETRARASVWATAMLVGGIIGLIIAASAGFFITTFAQSINGDPSSLGTVDPSTLC
jgi:Na+-driven multidrug efflux pump